jgi:hypothetical protein
MTEGVRAKGTAMETKARAGLRTSIRLLLAVAIAMCAAAEAAAQDDHRLSATAGDVSDFTTDPSDVTVEASKQFGVPGVDDASFAFEASVYGASGVVAAESFVDAGLGLPFLSSGYEATASLEQWLEYDGYPPEGPVTITFAFPFSASAELSGIASSARVTVRLDVTSACRLSVTVQANQDDELSDGCDGPFGNANFGSSVGSGGMTVVVSYAAGDAPSVIAFRVLIETAISAGSATTIASASGSGALSVAIEGADGYRFAAPDLLTAPEPDASLLGVTAAMLVGGIARRRET